MSCSANCVQGVDVGGAAVGAPASVAASTNAAGAVCQGVSCVVDVDSGVTLTAWSTTAARPVWPPPHASATRLMPGTAAFPAAPRVSRSRKSSPINPARRASRSTSTRLVSHTASLLARNPPVRAALVLGGQAQQTPFSAPPALPHALSDSLEAAFRREEPGREIQGLRPLRRAHGAAGARAAGSAHAAASASKWPDVDFFHLHGASPADAPRDRLGL
ncbi:MAG: hypothetical protein RL385_163 [Pseudomonadota bacterium]